MPAIGISKSVVFKRKTLTAPNGAPSALKVIGITDSTQTFEFTPGSTNHDGHRLYMSTDGGINYTLKASVFGATSTIQATGLTAGTLYYFYVVAYKGSQESTATNIYDTHFKITVDTTKAGSANTTFVLPIPDSGTFNYFVDWGDGGAEENFTTAGDKTHIYSTSGIYPIKIRGAMPGFAFGGTGDRLKLMSIDNWGNIAWNYMSGMFHGCSNVVANYIDQPNTAAVTDMYGMFRSCFLFNGAVNGFDTSNVTTTIAMFTECYVFNQPVSNFNMSNVEDIHAMFQDARKFNQSVAGWNLSSCIYGNRPFQAAWEFNQPVNWSMPVCVTNDVMFFDCKALNSPITLSLPESLAVDKMFQGCTVFNSAVNITCPKATNLSYMFFSLAQFNAPVSIDCDAAQDFSNMFNGCTVFNQPVTLKTGAAINMSSMFANCKALNSAIVFTGGTATVTSMAAMFQTCSVFNQPLSFLNDTGLVENMSYMFSGCSWLNQNVTFDTVSVTNMRNMFANAISFEGIITFSDTSNVTDMQAMFSLAGKVNCPLNFDTSAVTNMSTMLWYCTRFKQDISGFDISAVTNITNMLQNSNINTTGTTTNYDALLIAWAAQTLHSGLSFHGGTSKYSAGAAAAARGVLTSAPNNWVIADGGQV